MVEQNARRALALSDRGYVLDMGRNAHEGTGADLLVDPRVAELYLGSMTSAPRTNGDRRPRRYLPRYALRRSSFSSRSAALPSRTMRPVERT